MVLKWFASFLKSLNNFSIRDVFFSQNILMKEAFSQSWVSFQTSFSAF